MSYGLVEANEIKGFTTDYANDINNVIIANRELYIYDKTDPVNPYSIGLFDPIKNFDVKIKSFASNLYYDGYILVSTGNLVYEINSAYTDGDPATYLTVSNICVFSNDPSNIDCYVNMSNTQGDSGIGLRFNHINDRLEIKDGSVDIPNWINFTALINANNFLKDLQDVNLSFPTNGQILTYDSGSYKWVNSTYTLPISLGMTSNSTTISDSTGVRVLQLSTNASDTAYIRIISGAGNGAVITTTSSTAMTDIPITIQSIGTGDITLDASGGTGGDISLKGNTVYTSANLDVNSTTYTQAVSFKSNSNLITLQAPAGLPASYNLVLPVDNGASQQALITDGSGNLSWTSIAGGSNGQVQYNSNGLCAGLSGLTLADTANVALTAGSYLLLGSNSSAISGNAGGITLQTNNSSGVFINSVIITTPQPNIVISNASISGSFAIQYSVIYFNLTDIINVGLTATYTITSATPQAGQNLHIFFDNAGTNQLAIDFGINGIGTGGGLARYLTFVNSGQSASMIYLNGIWRIINTGALVS